jgi:hypothetical protein
MIMYRRLKLPPDTLRVGERVGGKAPPPVPALERDMFQRPTSRATVCVPIESIAGVEGEDAERFDDYQDERPRIVPVTHCWTPAGDVLVGCKGGQLLKVSRQHTAT